MAEGGEGVKIRRGEGVWVVRRGVSRDKVRGRGD